MPRVEFELTTPVYEQQKILHALGCAATVIGNFQNVRPES
jgi:hypothetical protein